MTRRTLLGVDAAAIALVGRPALAQARPSALQLSWLRSVQFAGSCIAQDRGYRADQGLDVALDPAGPNVPVEPPVVAGTALVGISAAGCTAAATAQGAPFRIIGVAIRKNRFGIASLAGNTVNASGKMEGKRIGMGAGEHSGPAGALGDHRR